MENNTSSNKQQFVHLHVHSHYSLLDGLPKIEPLIKKAKEFDMNAVALTDHGSLYGAIEFYKTAKKHGIKPIIGSEVYIAARRMQDKQAGLDDRRFHLILLAQDNKGYKNLIKLITVANLEGFYYKPRLDKETLRKYSDGLIALSACMGGEIPRAILAQDFELAEKLILEYKDIFGKNFYLELGYHPGIKQLEKLNQKLIVYAKQFDIPLVATQDVHYLHKEDAKSQDTLMAVQTGGARLGEGDRITLGQDDYSFKSTQEMYETFPYPKEALKNTQKIADSCNVEIELGIIQLPHFDVPKGQTDNTYLRTLCLSKIADRYEEPNKEVMDRLDYELGIIEKTGFASYFLIVQDFVRWAKEHGILVGPGRGSAAGSIVSYILGITNMDPVAYKLLFERFLNPERKSMPDIDLDFPDTGRDRVIAYVAEKYGKDHVAQIITFGTMAARAAIKDTGRALGMPYELCDKLSKLIPFGESITQALIDAPELKELYDKDKDAKIIIDTAKKLEGVSRHASTHACGVVVSKSPLHEMVPLQYAAKQQDDMSTKNSEKQIVTQYEMHAIEDLGLLKMDFLGLKNLSLIERTLKLIKIKHNKEVNLDKIPLNDKKTFALLQTAQTTGVFQLESSGMKKYLKELKPTVFEDIIVMVSLYRPGPLDAGMVEEYIARKHGKKEVIYLHPMLKPILENTYGIIVYQEQLMQIANVLGNFSLPQGYILIKAVGKKIKKLLDEQRGKLVEGMVKNSIPKKTAEQIWNFIEPFARYGFNRSHAACYALIGYQTAFLKAHFPAEFMASLMTSDFGDIERVAFLVEEAKIMGIETSPPDINKSFKKFTVVSDTEIRFGLIAIKNVGEKIVEIIIESRGDTPFISVEDFIGRTKHKDLNKKSFEALIKCGALDQLGERNQLMTNLETLLQYMKDNQQAASSNQIGLFDAGPIQLTAFTLIPAEPAPAKQKLTWEKELLGLYISDHPLSQHKDFLEKHSISIQSINDNIIGKTVKLGGIVSGIKKIITKKGDPMAFATLKDLKGSIDLVIFPKTMEKTRDIWQEDALVIMSGKIDIRNDAYQFICNKVKLIPEK